MAIIAQSLIDAKSKQLMQSEEQQHNSRIIRFESLKARVILRTNDYQDIQDTLNYMIEKRIIRYKDLPHNDGTQSGFLFLEGVGNVCAIQYSRLYGGWTIRFREGTWHILKPISSYSQIAESTTLQDISKSSDEDIDNLNQLLRYFLVASDKFVEEIMSFINKKIA